MDPQIRSKSKALLCCAIAAFVAGCSSHPTVRGNRLEFSLPDSNGVVVSNSDARFNGKVVLVDLWGLWCPGCHVQMPELVRLHDRYADDGLEIVGINLEMLLPDDAQERRARLQRIAEDFGIEYPLLDGGRVQDVDRVLPMLRSIQGYPVTIFIGRDGTVRAVESGFHADDAVRHEERIRKLLAEPAP